MDQTSAPSQGFISSHPPSTASISAATNLLDAPIATLQPLLQAPKTLTATSDITSSLPPIATSPVSPRSAPKHGPATHIGGGVGGGRGEEIGQLKLKVHYLESIAGRLQRENSGMEEEFGRQRKKFMKQMMELECELKDSLHSQSLSLSSLPLS